MILRFAFTFLFSVVFAQGGFTVQRSSDGTATFYPIDPGLRGADLVAHFNLLSKDSSFKTDRSQIALQTTQNGLIPNLQELIPMTNGTYLLAKYLMPNFSVPKGNAGKDSTGTSFGYVAVPVEQVVSLIYSPGLIPASSAFTSQVPQGTLPVFSVDLSQRAADLQEVVRLLANPPIANFNLTAFPVSIQTTLDGPFYTGGTGASSLIVNGLIPQVVSVSASEAPNGSLLLVTFKAPRPNQFTTSQGFATVVVAPDQIIKVNFTQN